MSTDTVLTDEQIFDCFDRHSSEIVISFDADDLYPVGRAIEQAVLQSPWVRARQWQPIETAPKDGTQILLWGPSCDMTTCFWAAYDSPPYWCIGSIEVDGDGFAALRGEPTHWLPLPAPPLPGPVEP